MIIDLRTYTYLPSKFRKFLKGYQDVGFALTSKHLGKTLGVLRSESGIQNRTFQFFMYEDSDHRDRCRAGMIADPAWAEFVKMDGDALLQQSNALLIPTKYSPVGGQAPRNAPTLAADGPSRLFELTTWTFWPDTADDAIQALADEGAPLIDRHSPDVILYASPDTGNRNQLLRLCAYESGAARDRARQAAAADPEVQALRGQLRRFVESVDESLLLPIPCSPLR
jgi:NIPSNAP